MSLSTRLSLTRLANRPISKSLLLFGFAVNGGTLRPTNSRCGDAPEARVADDVAVHFKKAPRQFDAKGKPITPTHEQLQALKGARSYLAMPPTTVT